MSVRNSPDRPKQRLGASSIIYKFSNDLNPILSPVVTTRAPRGTANENLRFHTITIQFKLGNGKHISKVVLGSCRINTPQPLRGGYGRDYCTVGVPAEFITPLIQNIRSKSRKVAEPQMVDTSAKMVWFHCTVVDQTQMYYVHVNKEISTYLEYSQVSNIAGGLDANSLTANCLVEITLKCSTSLEVVTPPDDVTWKLGIKLSQAYLKKPSSLSAPKPGSSRVDDDNVVVDAEANKAEGELASLISNLVLGG